MMADEVNGRTRESVKVQAELSRTTYDALVELAARRGLDANTVLQQAIGTEKLFADNVGVEDEVLIKKPDQTWSRVLFERIS